MAAFMPSIDRAHSLRREMDAALWDSARDILVELGETAPQPSSDGRAEPTRMLDFACFFDLDRHLRQPDSLPHGTTEAAASHLRQRLSQAIPLAPQASTPTISNFDASDFSAEDLERMSRWWDTEPANRMAVEAANKEEFDNCREGIGVALGHLLAAAPEMAGEVDLLVRDIVLSKPGPGSRLNYSGATSFGLWGAITINAETQRDWIQLYRQVVHETAHNLLFAIARGTPLVGAAPSIRRRSPIRADARPLDGIFHAAYVSAREAFALDALLIMHERDDVLSAEDAGIVMDTLELSVLAFWDCVGTLRDDPDGLTELGNTVLSECETWVAASFDLEPV